MPDTLGSPRAPFAGKTDTTLTPTWPAAVARAGPGRHQQERRGAPVALDLVVVAHRHDHVAAEGLRERVDERGEGERPVDLRGGDDAHRAYSEEPRDEASAGTPDAAGRLAQPLGLAAQLARLAPVVRRSRRLLPCASQAAMPPITTPSITAAKITAKSGRVVLNSGAVRRTDRRTASPARDSRPRAAPPTSATDAGEAGSKRLAGTCDSSPDGLVTRDPPCAARATLTGFWRRRRVEAHAHLLAGLEHRDHLLVDRDGLAGARVAAGARVPLLDREGAEAAQLDPVAAGQRVGDGVEDRVDDVLDVPLVQMRVLLGDLRARARI